MFWENWRTTLCVVFVTILALWFSPEIAAQEWEISPVFVEEPPRIDGSLNDAIWTEIDPITEFTQVWPDEGEVPTELSEVRIAYNRDYLFFAFRFLDEEAHLIRAKNLERGGRNDRDDHAYISLDTYLDKRNAYLFEMNALGTQDDATITDEGLTLDSFSWDAVFRSETQIDEDGWTMEVSIPFRQLRFPKGETVDFGLMLSRMINRKNERVIWPPIGLEFGGQFGVISAVSQYGVLRGLHNIRRGKNIEIKPYVITGIQQTREDYNVKDIPSTFERDIGIDFKYGITSNVTLDLTINTDFAQVEADNVQLNLTRFSLFFPEKREFFLERSGLFEHGNPRSTQTFFSRRIGLRDQILTGARATGQFGRLSIGLLDIETGEGMGDTFGSKSTNNLVARLRTSLSSRATVGAILTNYAAPDRVNRAFGMDAQYRFWSASEFEAWYTRVTDDGPIENDEAGHASLTLMNDKYGIEASITSVGENFHPALGFVRRRDMRRFSGGAQYTPIVSFDALPFIRQFNFQSEYEY
ncbi:MAG: carbohydrate binding family 9 domain-containing protein, partial [Rhodothermaceae bacterium]|nr:carbohydrate binding family 9 domain-containing protein [Rhodothermaceae bacterium]